MLLDTEEGQEVLVDLFVETDDATYVFLCPHTMDARYTKEKIEKFYFALESINAFYNTHIIIFSIERFSAWCVHEAKRNQWLHEVTLERLRY